MMQNGDSRLHLDKASDVRGIGLHTTCNLLVAGMLCSAVRCCGSIHVCCSTCMSRGCGGRAVCALHVNGLSA